MSLHRSLQTELLDDLDQCHPAELAENLRDMARYDRWLGAYDLALRLATAGLPVEALRIGLDVGAGSAEFLSFARRRCGLGMQWIGLDHARSVLQVAHVRDATAPLLCATVERLPFADASLDVITCAHTLHHLDETHTVALLRECARVARRRLVVLDLARNHIALAGAWLLTRATSHNRMTLRDGVHSVRRAYTPEEAVALAARAGLAGARIEARNPFRYALAWTRCG